jgi:hypothetical protein
MIMGYLQALNYRKWQMAKVTYSNRQVKGTEDLFGPDDADALLVGGTTLPSPDKGTNVVINNQMGSLGNLSPEDFDNLNGSEEEEVDDEGSDPNYVEPGDLEAPQELATVTKVTFQQVGKFTPNGTFLADVVATIEDVKGAVDYEVTYFRIS